jgi:ADP-heptose:LPS heptosyltransferase
MAQTWTPTLWKRLVVAGLNAFAGVKRALPGARQRPAGDSNEIRRILVVELWNIGDVVLTMPFLAELRAMFPLATTTLLAPPHAEEVLRGTGLVDDFIEIDISSRETWLTRNPLAYDWRRLWRLRDELRSREFDLAFQCRLHIREHVIVGLSGAHRRVGYSFDGADGLLTDAVPVADASEHKADEWLRLLEPFGKPFGKPFGAKPPSLNITEDENQKAKAYLSASGISPAARVIGIHPGASIADKRWPLDRFHELAVALAERQDVRVLAFVDPQGYGESLGAIKGVVSARVPLRELMALLAHCDLLVCNDSGPMHIAGALGVPTVAVFSAGIDRWFSPLGEGHEVVSAERPDEAPNEGVPSHKVHSLTAIPTSQVLSAVERVLGERRKAAF